MVIPPTRTLSSLLKIKKAYPRSLLQSSEYFDKRRRKEAFVSVSAGQVGSHGVKNLRLSDRTLTHADQSPRTGERKNKRGRVILGSDKIEGKKFKATTYFNCYKKYKLNTTTKLTQA